MTTRGDTPGTTCPLRCLFCGETWIGSRRMIGKACQLDPLSSPSVVQCDPEELESSVDWEREVF